MKMSNSFIVRIICIFVWILINAGCNLQDQSDSEVGAIQTTVIPSLVNTPTTSDIADIPTSHATALIATALPATATATVTATPSPTRQPVAAKVTATATAQTRMVTPDVDEVTCERPDDLNETEVDVTGPTFCVVWLDQFDDELGFTVHLEYFQSGERFVYAVEPNVTQLIVPEDDSPRLAESFEQCVRRKDYTITVVALRPNGEQQINKLTVNVECGGVGETSLPTATVDP
mgnify:CR=1 FL=1